MIENIQNRKQFHKWSNMADTEGQDRRQEQIRNLTWIIQTPHDQ